MVCICHGCERNCNTVWRFEAAVLRSDAYVGGSAWDTRLLKAQAGLSPKARDRQRSEEED